MSDRHLAGEAFDDVEAHRQDDVDADDVDDVLSVRIRQQERQRQQQQPGDDPRHDRVHGFRARRRVRARQLSAQCFWQFCCHSVAIRCGLPLIRMARLGGHRQVAAVASRSARRLKAEARLERHAGEHAHVVVLAALRVLDEDARPVAVAALRRRLGAEVDRTRGQTGEVLDVGQRVADRSAIGLQRGIRQIEFRVLQGELDDLRRLIGLAEVVIGAADLYLVCTIFTNSCATGRSSLQENAAANVRPTAASPASSGTGALEAAEAATRRTFFGMPTS